jgi:hypothetical protein
MLSLYSGGITGILAEILPKYFITSSSMWYTAFPGDGDTSRKRTVAQLHNRNHRTRNSASQRLQLVLLCERRSRDIVIQMRRSKLLHLPLDGHGDGDATLRVDINGDRVEMKARFLERNLFKFHDALREPDNSKPCLPTPKVPAFVV